MDIFKNPSSEVKVFCFALVIVLIMLILLKLWHVTWVSKEGLEDRQMLPFSSGATQRHYQELTAANQDPYSTLTVIEMKSRGTNQAFSGSSVEGSQVADATKAAVVPVAAAVAPVTAAPSVTAPATTPVAAPAPLANAVAVAKQEKLSSTPEAPFFWGVFGDYGEQEPPGGARESPITWGVGDSNSLLKKMISGQPELPTGRQGIRRENFAEAKNVYGGTNWNKGEDVLQDIVLTGN